MSTRVIAIDWSGAKRNAAKKIWRAEFREGQPFDLPWNGKNPSEILDYLVRSCGEHRNTVVGIDFAFSFPGWFIADQGCRTAEEMWNRVEGDGERWLKECRNPFWGRPGKKNPRRPENEQFRKTDRDFLVKGIRPKSVFQIGGAGAVGTGSICGMRLLRQLSCECFSIWPFQPNGWPRVIEIWPRVLTGEVHKSDPNARKEYLDTHCHALPTEWKRYAADSEDAFDAIVSAIEMNRYVGELESLQQEIDPQYSKEGRIWAPRKGMR
jgi:hypothetical protein